MKRTILALTALICAATLAHAQTFPANDANAKLVHSRAVEAVIWGMAAVNNNITAKKNGEGSVTVQFGGCDGKVLNCPAR